MGGRFFVHIESLKFKLVPSPSIKAKPSTVKENSNRGVFRTQFNIYDGDFCVFTAFSSQLFWQKRSIVDVRLGSKYASEPNHTSGSCISRSCLQ